MGAKVPENMQAAITLRNKVAIAIPARLRENYF